MATTPPRRSTPDSPARSAERPRSTGRTAEGRADRTGRPDRRSGPGRTGHGTGRRRPGARQRRLRREIPGTVAVLTSPEDLAAMRRYRTFRAHRFTAHHTYLRQLECVLRTLAAQGLHTTIARFDPAEYEQYCTDSRLDPDRPTSRTRYTADIAAGAATIPYTGRPLADVLPELIEETEREALWDRAAALLAGVGACEECGEDLGHAAFERASHCTLRILEALSPGRHHLVCSVSAGEGAPILAALHADATAEGRFQLAESDALIFCTVLAAGIALGTTGGIVARTTDEHGADTVRGWSLRDSWPHPLTASEVFAAYCTDARTGDPISPEPGVDYLPGLPLTPWEDADRHRHHH